MLSFDVMVDLIAFNSAFRFSVQLATLLMLFMINIFNVIYFACFHVNIDVHHIARLTVSRRMRKWKCICYSLSLLGTILLFGSLISMERDLETAFLFYDLSCL